MPTKILPAPGSKRAKTKKDKEADPKPPEKKETRIHKTFHVLRHDFSDAEIRDMAIQAARATKSADDLEVQKKNVTAQLGNEIKVARARASQLSDSITSGYEMRSTECEAFMNWPIEGLKMICRKDKGWPDCVVAVDKMLAHEMQEEIPLEDKPPADPDDQIPDHEERAPEEEEEEEEED